MRFPKPWYRPSRGLWYVTLDGKQHNLGPDREAAFALYKELIAQPTDQDVSSDSVLAIIDAFLDWTHNHRAPRTYDWYKERLQEFVRCIPPDLEVCKFKPFHVQKWIDGKECSDGHKRGCVTAALRAMNWAVRMGHIEKNPIGQIEKPPAGKRETIVMPAQFEQVIALCRDEQFTDLLTVAWETGARPQELLNVEARHVDLSHSRWVFPKDESKGKKRQRVVYLSDTAIEITRRLVMKHPDGKLFRNSNGEPWGRNAVQLRFGRMKKHIGVKFCLYNFRHTFATRMIEEGVDALIVATLMGHADLSMLGRTYAHLTQNADHLLKHLRRNAG